MSDKSNITEGDFIAACCTVTAILASAFWKRTSSARTPIQRANALPAAALDCQSAAKYCGFGRTKFRQLVNSGVFPAPVSIEGRKRWLTKDLDTALARIGKRPRSFH